MRTIMKKVDFSALSFRTFCFKMITPPPKKSHRCVSYFLFVMVHQIEHFGFFQTHFNFLKFLVCTCKQNAGVIKFNAVIPLKCSNIRASSTHISRLSIYALSFERQQNTVQQIKQKSPFTTQPDHHFIRQLTVY